MKKIWQRIKKDKKHAFMGILMLIGGIYILTHVNYLDSPLVTAPPPYQGVEKTLIDFIDDNWFGWLIVSSGVLFILGVVLAKHSLVNFGSGLALAITVMITIVFAYRGVIGYRFNLTWWLSGFTAYLIGKDLGRWHKYEQ